MEEKKKYTIPCFETITIELDDIIATSTCTGANTESGGEVPIVPGCNQEGFNG